MSELTSPERIELEVLRARVLELERERSEELARANATIAALQERMYWLDRWHLDLNALMARPGAAQLRGSVRLLRRPVRLVRIVKRKLLGG